MSTQHHVPPVVDYEHSRNVHTLEGPRAALPVFFSHQRPRSILDVGCGPGTWLRAAVDFGIIDVYGVDGVDIPTEQLLFERRLFRYLDLCKPWSIGRRFDMALCLEVAEHLDEACATVLVDALVAHADVVLFSAACPAQPGQHHVNCQWPEYWQRLFNARRYRCDDTIRWQIWNEPRIEPWYRQNVFVAAHDPARAGAEPRIKAVIHPEVQELITATSVNAEFAKHVAQIENGQLSVAWYLKAPISALIAKLRRRISSKHGFDLV